VLQYYPWIEIAIRSCKNGGIDTKIHGVSIIGRMNMNEEEVAASFSLLSVEEAEGKEVGLIRRQRKIDETQGDGSPFKVYVWGLNDKHQLGCLQSDSKVSLLEKGGWGWGIELESWWGGRSLVLFHWFICFLQDCGPGLSLSSHRNAFS